MRKNGSPITQLFSPLCNWSAFLIVQQRTTVFLYYAISPLKELRTNLRALTMMDGIVRSRGCAIFGFSHRPILKHQRCLMPIRLFVNGSVSVFANEVRRDGKRRIAVCMSIYATR